MVCKKRGWGLPRTLATIQKKQLANTRRNYQNDPKHLDPCQDIAATMPGTQKKHTLEGYPPKFAMRYGAHLHELHKQATLTSLRSATLVLLQIQRVENVDMFLGDWLCASNTVLRIPEHKPMDRACAVSKLMRIMSTSAILLALFSTSIIMLHVL